MLENITQTKYTPHYLKLGGKKTVHIYKDKIYKYTVVLINKILKKNDIKKS